MGWANFDGQTIQEYAKYGFFDSMFNVYNTAGTLEYQADKYAFERIAIPGGIFKK